MPNRILKESICTSDSIDSLGWFDEVLFYRLIVNCDDYGRFDGRPAIIKNRLFPLKENLTAKTVARAIEKLASAGLVTLYVFEGKPYLYLPTWNHHQSVRAKFSKYPAPEDGCERMKSSASNCNQMNANVPVFECDIRESIFENRESNVGAEPEPASAPPVAELPLNDGSLFRVYAPDASKWSTLYPAVNVLQELRKMTGWLDANPKRRKTKAGIRSFITSWLAREQDRGGAAPARTAYRSKNEERNAQFQQHDGSLSPLELEAIQKALRDGAPDE
nr:MAG TPA: replisome organizer [Caudoviricetes sp.]